MKKRQICKKKNDSLIFLLCLFGIIWSFCGCSKEKEVFSETSETLLPGLQGVLKADEMAPESDSISEYQFPPVRIYFDNTGSMEGFTINNEGRRGPCSAYIKLMRCLRDMGRVRETQYYILDVNRQDWVLSEMSIYDCFTQNGFHVWWKSEQPGPLSKLLMENRIDETCINIVLTDLAEQNLNITQLAEQIRKMCDQKKCEVDLFAFKFDFNGVTQVPDPELVSGMREGDVNEKRPYYMMVTGPSGYIERYIEELKEMLSGDGLEEGAEYFTVTNRSDMKHQEMDLSNVIFEPFADYDEINQEMRDETENEEDEEKKIENEKEVYTGVGKTSKNLQRHENIGRLFEDGEEFDLSTFYYQKERGVAKNHSDWRLNFYIPLIGWGESQKAFSYQYTIYHIEETEMGLSSGEQQTETGTIQRRWVKSADDQTDVSLEVYRHYETDEGVYPAVLYVSISNKNALEHVKPELSELLVVVDITQEDIITPQRPDWMNEFDTGDMSEIFNHTYGLSNFYNVLFGYEDEAEKDGTVHIKSNYIQVPILLTDLEKQEI